jgi:hypothetical protein
MGAYYYNHGLIWGCMDPIALNYNPNANMDDGSCEYFEGTVWRVAIDGSDETGDGTFENPFATIQHGIDVSGPNEAVLVAEGIYHENITNLNETLIGAGIGKSIIRGVNYDTNPVVTVNSTTVLMGFTITNGWGAGINASANTTIINCEISNNMGSGINMGGYNEHHYIYNCKILNNGSSGISAGCGVDEPLFKILQL